MEDNSLYRIRSVALFVVCVVFLTAIVRFSIIEFPGAVTGIKENDEITVIEEPLPEPEKKYFVLIIKVL